MATEEQRREERNERKAKHKREAALSWYFGFVPTWVIDAFAQEEALRDEMHLHTHAKHGYDEHVGKYAQIESFGSKVRGKHYEYVEVVVLDGGTHSTAIAKRKL
jgi:hypothetical protein